MAYDVNLVIDQTSKYVTVASDSNIKGQTEFYALQAQANVVKSLWHVALSVSHLPRLMLCLSLPNKKDVIKQSTWGKISMG